MLAPMDTRRDLARAWQAVLGRLQLELSPHAFTTFEGARPVALEGDALLVEAPNAFTCDWLNRQLGTVVSRAARQVEASLEVRFVAPGERAPAPGDAAPREVTVVGVLNASFTLERYLEAQGNRLALRACTALLDPGLPTVSPVVVYGAPGLGKTHLLHAIAHRAAGQGWPVACLSAEEFTSRYHNPLRQQRAGDFQAELRGVRLLVIDDLQYVSGKKATCEELAHSIDAVTNGGGHVLVAGERHPTEIDLPERLVSRLCGGLVARILPFAAPERRCYIARLAADFRASLPTFAVERIAALEAASARVLLGAGKLAVTLARGGQLDPAQLDTQLITLTSGAACQRPLDAALEGVARHFALSAADLAGRSRSPRVTEARAVAVVVLRQRGLSLAQAGAALGGRDRSTISQLEARGRALAEATPALQALLAS